MCSSDLSPAMHNELFRRQRIDAIYVAFDVPGDRAGAVAGAVRTLGLAGVNLTVPFKERVLPELDDLSATARVAGAVNVVIREADRLVGYNTDGEGYLRALQEELRRGIVGAATPRSRGERIPLGEGSDVLAATWGAITRIRDVVERRSQGAVRFDLPAAPRGLPGAQVVKIGRAHV